MFTPCCACKEQPSPAADGKRQLLLAVADTGVGISSQDQKLLFARFTPLSASCLAQACRTRKATPPYMEGEAPILGRRLRGSRRQALSI